MGLRLHNTLTRTKEDFVPIDPANVRMYVCGPTVYDFAHIGNARPLIVFDVLFRLLRHLYGPEHVTYVRNITDVDDKIIARAGEAFPEEPLNAAIQKVTERTTRQFHEDVAALGCLPPTVEPRATQHIAEMKAMIEELIAKGFAYVGEDHVLFRVSAMADYGKLSNRTLDEMVAGARVEVAPYKQDPMDFVLWKPSKPGEPAWPSPAGIATPGRPGWHLECSAMSDKWLWDEVKDRLSPEGRAHPHEFDIHGGGIDLVFPHHENEIAQSRCAHGTPLMARYWLHNGFLQVEGEKMSKSLGNFVTINELLATDKFGGRSWPGAVLRFAMLMTHYRQPIDWTLSALAEAEQVLHDWSSLHERSGDHGRTRRRCAVGRRKPCRTISTHRLRLLECTRCARSVIAVGLLSRDAPSWASADVVAVEHIDWTIERSSAERAHCRPRRRAQREELRRSRPHPCRARCHGHRAQGFEGPRNR